MPHDRFFLDERFTPQREVFLEGAEAHHLRRVMRVNVQEKVELINGRCQLAYATVLTLEKEGVRLSINNVLEVPPLLPFILCQAIPRPNKLDIIIEKGAELGVSEIWLFSGERGEKETLSANQEKRAQALFIGALKQSGRLDLPKLLLKPPLIKWNSSDLPYPAYFGSLAPGASSFYSLYQSQNGICFFVGPEAGFSAAEEKKMKELGVQGAHLHPYILRTETASLVALSQFYGSCYLPR